MVSQDFRDRIYYSMNKNVKLADKAINEIQRNPSGSNTITQRGAFVWIDRELEIIVLDLSPSEVQLLKS